MRHLLQLAAVALALAGLLLLPSPATAANPGAMHTVTGRIMQVQGGNGTGRFLVQTSSKNQLNNGAARKGGKIFQFGPGTQFVTMTGGVTAPAGFASLAPGTRVRVTAVGRNATIVHILPPRVRGGLNGAVPLGQVPRTTAHPHHWKQASLRHPKR